MLRPIAESVTQTSEDALAPTLEQLRAGFPTRLQAAVADAINRLDEFLHVETGVVVKTVQTKLNQIEIANEAQLDALLVDLKARVKACLDRGERVRLT